MKDKLTIKHQNNKREFKNRDTSYKQLQISITRALCSLIADGKLINIKWHNICIFHKIFPTCEDYGNFLPHF